MSAVYIPNNCGEATLSWHHSSKTNPVTSTLGFEVYPGSYTPAEVADFVQGCFSITGGYCDPVYMADEWTFDGCTVVMRVAGDLLGAADATGPYGGAGGSVAIPPLNCSFLVQKRTASVGRDKRGRMYLPDLHLAETYIDAMGQFTNDTYYGVVNGKWMVTAGELLGDANFHPQVLHEATVTAPTPITSLPLTHKMATQRRRLRN